MVKSFRRLNYAPRLFFARGAADPKFIEYVGQGDSDKPAGYRYSTMERADLVETRWATHGVRATFVVTFDYSSLVLLELLAGQVFLVEAPQQGWFDLLHPQTALIGILFFP